MRPFPLRKACLGLLSLVALLVLTAPASAEVPEALRFWPVFQLPETMDLCGESVPLSDQQVWERLDREFTIAVYDHAQVFLWLRRMSRYFPHIEKELKERHMPDDLKFLAVVESALIPDARSRKGAYGPWQFIQSTALKYGLRVDSRVDERFSFEHATKAALSYLTDLYALFGKWSLAMAAYNCGERRMQVAVQEQGQEEYYRLTLPDETERYIFRILAAKLILSDPERYGYCPLDPRARYQPPESHTVRVTFHEPVHIRTVAQACGSYFKMLKDLNPEVKGLHFPAGTYDIRIPEEGQHTFARFYREYQKKPKPRGPRIHVVQAGEHLSGIAGRYGVSLKALKLWNGLTRDTIHPGQRLRIY